MTGARSPWAIGFVLPISLMGFAPGFAAEAEKPAALFVLDASRTMEVKIEDRAKIAIARESLGHAVTAYEDQLSLGLAAYGHSMPDCAGGETLAAPGTLTEKSHAELLAKPKPKGAAAIAAAITQAEKTKDRERLDLIVIAGSGDSCKKDVCAAAQGAKASTPGLRIHAIAFDAAADRLAPLSCIAEKTGGRFLAAANQTQLDQALTTILTEIAAPGSSGLAAGLATSLPSLGADAGETSMDLSGSFASSGFSSEPPSLAKPSLAKELPTADLTSALPAIGFDEAMLAPGLLAPPPVADLRRAQPSPAETEGVVTTTARIAATAKKMEEPPPPPAKPVPVTFKALLTEDGQQLQTGLVWRIFANGADGQRLVSTHRDPDPSTELLPGDYLVNAAYGLSNLTKKVHVESGKPLEESFVLNTGGLRLSAMLANRKPLAATAVNFDIFSDEEDQFGNRQKILGDARPGTIIRLNAGAYHVVSVYGDSNAAVRADVTVEPGKVTDATMKHAAGKVTFRLVQQPGGEALADTHWTILTPRGEVVQENAGALPSHTLAAGKYSVVAAFAGENYSREFSVETGDMRQIEVVIEDGPISAEALRALTNPAPASPSESGPVYAGSGSDSETGAAFAPSSPRSLDLGIPMISPGFGR
jgi:hypothetical protein